MSDDVQVDCLVDKGQLDIRDTGGQVIGFGHFMPDGEFRGTIVLNGSGVWGITEQDGTPLFRLQYTPAQPGGAMELRAIR